MWRRKGEVLCVRPFWLHRQQDENDRPKQNVEFAPLEKFLRTPMFASFGGHDPFGPSLVTAMFQTAVIHSNCSN